MKNVSHQISHYVSQFTSFLAQKSLIADSGKRKYNTTMKLRWKPTDIGGQIGKHDFVAFIYGVGVGRIMRADHSFQKNVWDWSFHCGHGDLAAGNRGTANTKQEAADKVRQRFELFRATPTDQGGGLGYEPEEFPPDSSSDALHRLKARDPKAFWQRIEDIRAGRIDRNYHRWIHDKSPLTPLTEDDY